jgi:hypothetical protein
MPVTRRQRTKTPDVGITDDIETELHSPLATRKLT